MRPIGTTIFSGLVFLGAAFFSGILPSSAAVSQQTTILERYRETFSVKHGVSQDGQLVIARVQSVPTVPPRKKAPNHERTLRAFIAPDRGGALTLYVESVKPHEYYTVTGSFLVSTEYPTLTWISGTTLQFYGLSQEKALMEYAADVHLLMLTQEHIDESAIPTEETSSGGLLP